MRKSILAGILTLALCLSGCAGKGNGAASGSVSGGNSSVSGGNGSASGAEPANVPTEAEIQAVRETFETALETLRTTGTLPGFEDILSLPAEEADYRYDITDIDGDGYEELYLVQDGGYMAAMIALILDGQGGELRTELSEFPALTFYSNGCIRADASHNQGLAGEFWPYVLYRYDAESDSYQCVAMVDAWDSAIYPRDDTGNAFPKDVDVSGKGIVYYIAENGESYGRGGTFEGVTPVDQADFNAWEAAWQGEDSVIRYPLENELTLDAPAGARG